MTDKNPYICRCFSCRLRRAKIHIFYNSSNNGYHAIMVKTEIKIVMGNYSITLLILMFMKRNEKCIDEDAKLKSVLRF